MNRRSFMKVLAAITAGIGLTGKAEEAKDKLSYEPEEKNYESVGDQVIFHKRKLFCAGPRRIAWTEINDIHSWQAAGYIDLPTYSDIQVLRLSIEGRLFFYGTSGEVWEMLHIGGIRVFCIVFGGIIKKEWRRVYSTEAICKGQAVCLAHLDDDGDLWIEPAPSKEFYK